MSGTVQTPCISPDKALFSYCHTLEKYCTDVFTKKVTKVGKKVGNGDFKLCSSTQFYRGAMGYTATHTLITQVIKKENVNQPDFLAYIICKHAFLSTKLHVEIKP